MTIARQRLGRAAEGLVARRLERAGWRIVARNARTASGELDLIALDGATLVFVEVKAGRLGHRGAGAPGARRWAPASAPRCGDWPASGWPGPTGPDRPGSTATASTSIGVSYDGARGAVEVEHIRGAF